MRILRFALLSGMAMAITAASATADLFYNPVVTVVSAGGAIVGGTGYETQIRIYEAGVSGQTSPISMTSFNSSSSGTRLVNSASGTSEGSLTNNPGVANAAAAGTLYTGTQYVYNGGYDAAQGTASVNGATANANRSFGQTNVTNNVASSATVLQTQTRTAAYTNDNFRGATGDDTGAAMYSAGQGTGSSQGWRDFGSNQRLHNSPTNVRTVELLSGGLFGSTGSGTVGLYLLNPAGNDTTAATLYIGTGTGRSPYEFALFDDPNNSATLNSGYDTAYISDDTASFGGIQKWVWDGSSWSNPYTLNSGSLTTYRGLAGQYDADTGEFTLFATVQDATTTRLQQVTDKGSELASEATFITLATLTTGTDNAVFRGVALSAVPEPTSMVLGAIAFGGAGIGFLRRRFRKEAAI